MTASVSAVPSPQDLGLAGGVDELDGSTVGLAKMKNRNPDPGNGKSNAPRVGNGADAGVWNVKIHFPVSLEPETPGTELELELKHTKRRTSKWHIHVSFLGDGWEDGWLGRGDWTVSQGKGEEINSA